MTAERKPPAAAQEPAPATPARRAFGSATAFARLVALPGLGYGAKLCYLLMLAYGRDSGRCYTSKASLAAQLRCSTRQIAYWWRDLERARLLRPERRPGRATFYSFPDLPWQPAPPLPVQPTSPLPVQPTSPLPVQPTSPLPVQPASPGGETSFTPHVQEIRAGAIAGGLPERNVHSGDDGRPPAARPPASRAENEPLAELLGRYTSLIGEPPAPADLSAIRRALGEADLAQFRLHIENRLARGLRPRGWRVFCRLAADVAHMPTAAAAAQPTDSRTARLQRALGLKTAP